MERNKSLSRYLGITISKASYLGNVRAYDKARKQIYSDAARFLIWEFEYIFKAQF